MRMCGGGGGGGEGKGRDRDILIVSALNALNDLGKERRLLTGSSTDLCFFFGSSIDLSFKSKL